MILSPQKIEEILNIIEFNHSMFIGANVGTDVLTPKDIKILKKFGINMSDIKVPFTPYEKQFYFGKLSQALGDKNTKKLKYEDFLQYLRRGQYEPLNLREKETLNLAKQRTYSHLKNLEQRVSQSVHEIIIQTSDKFRTEFEKVAKNSIKRAILERNSVSSIISEIGHKTGDWNRDLGRIAATEMQTIYEEGRAAEIEKRYGKDALVHKDVYLQACRFCIKFYCTNGLGSKPKLFTLDELRGNGSNIGRKQADWKPTLPATHPFCRCNIHAVQKGKIWNEDKKRFEYPKIDWDDPDRDKIGIKVTVNDKVFEV